MGNAAIDHEKQDALNSARMQPPKADDFHVPQNGRADNYLQEGAADNYEEQNSESGNHASRLDQARNRTAKTEEAKARDAIGDAASAATPMGAFSLLKQVNPMTDMPYVAAMGSAMIKDLSDLVLFETVILPVLFSMMCSIFIFMMLLLVGNVGKKKGANKFLKKIGFLLAGAVADSVPGINFFPTETLTVATIYFLELSERKHAQ